MRGERRERQLPEVQRGQAVPRRGVPVVHRRRPARPACRARAGEAQWRAGCAQACAQPRRQSNLRRVSAVC